MPKTMGRTTTKTPTRCHPLHLLLSKCWLCKHRCLRPCSRPWSTSMHNSKRHRRRGIGWEIFSALSCQPFLMLWSQWMLMFGSSLLSRRCKWCSATTMRRCYLPLTNFLVLQPTGGMLTWKPMRNLRASTSRSSELLSMYIMFPKELSRSEIGVHVCERGCHQVHSTTSLRPAWSRHWWDKTGVFLEWPEWTRPVC
jgi:hypothetical protein